MDRVLEGWAGCASSHLPVLQEVHASTEAVCRSLGDAQEGVEAWVRLHSPALPGTPPQPSLAERLQQIEQRLASQWAAEDGARAAELAPSSPPGFATPLPTGLLTPGPLSPCNATWGTIVPAAQSPALDRLLICCNVRDVARLPPKDRLDKALCVRAVLGDAPLQAGQQQAVLLRAIAEGCAQRRAGPALNRAWRLLRGTQGGAAAITGLRAADRELQLRMQEACTADALLRSVERHCTEVRVVLDGVGPGETDRLRDAFGLSEGDPYAVAVERAIDATVTGNGVSQAARDTAYRLLVRQGVVQPQARTVDTDVLGRVSIAVPVVSAAALCGEARRVAGCCLQGPVPLPSAIGAHALHGGFDAAGRVGNGGVVRAAPFNTARDTALPLVALAAAVAAYTAVPVLPGGSGQLDPAHVWCACHILEQVGHADVNGVWEVFGFDSAVGAALRLASACYAPGQCAVDCAVQVAREVASAAPEVQRRLLRGCLLRLDRGVPQPPLPFAPLRRARELCAALASREVKEMQHASQLQHATAPTSRALRHDAADDADALTAWVDDTTALSHLVYVFMTEWVHTPALHPALWSDMETAVRRACSEPPLTASHATTAAAAAPSEGEADRHPAALLRQLQSAAQTRHPPTLYRAVGAAAEALVQTPGFGVPPAGAARQRHAAPTPARCAWDAEVRRLSGMQGGADRHPAGAATSDADADESCDPLLGQGDSFYLHRQNSIVGSDSDSDGEGLGFCKSRSAAGCSARPRSAVSSASGHGRRSARALRSRSSLRLARNSSALPSDRAVVALVVGYVRQLQLHPHHPGRHRLQGTRRLFRSDLSPAATSPRSPRGATALAVPKIQGFAGPLASSGAASPVSPRSPRGGGGGAGSPRYLELSARSKQPSMRKQRGSVVSMQAPEMTLDDVHDYLAANCALPDVGVWLDRAVDSVCSPCVPDAVLCACVDHLQGVLCRAPGADPAVILLGSPRRGSQGGACLVESVTGSEPSEGPPLQINVCSLLAVLCLEAAAKALVAQPPSTSTAGELCRPDAAVQHAGFFAEHRGTLNAMLCSVLAEQAAALAAADEALTALQDPLLEEMQEGLTTVFTTLSKATATQRRAARRGAAACRVQRAWRCCRARALRRRQEGSDPHMLALCAGLRALPQPDRTRLAYVRCLRGVYLGEMPHRLQRAAQAAVHARTRLLEARLQRAADDPAALPAALAAADAELDSLSPRRVTPRVVHVMCLVHALRARALRAHPQHHRQEPRAVEERFALRLLPLVRQHGCLPLGAAVALECSKLYFDRRSIEDSLRMAQVARDLDPALQEVDAMHHACEALLLAPSLAASAAKRMHEAAGDSRVLSPATSLS